MPALGQLRARMSQREMRAARKTTTTRNTRRRGIYKTAALYAYQIPKQILKTAASVCRPW